MENAQPEPSMEEILASIRRIISEDEEDGAPGTASTQADSTPSAAAKSAAPSVSPPPVSSAEKTEPVTPLVDDAKPHLKTEDVEMIKKNTAEAVIGNVGGSILDDTSAQAASDAFSALSQSVRVTASEGPGRTLEEIVVDMLQPMVKDWLDANLPAIVEEKVEEEVQRVARRRR